MSTTKFISQLFQSCLHGRAISLSNIELELQNEEYYGARFSVNKHSVRFRKGKLTPTKVGFFVVAWEKDCKNKNQAYSYDNAPDFLIIYCEKEHHSGLFVFPKDILLKHSILSSKNQKGKMGFRVYPPYETDLNKQATQSQIWQCKYFFYLENSRESEVLTELF